MGNTGSIMNMIKKVGGRSTISSNPEEIFNAEKLILPGVGAFDKGMDNLKKKGLLPVLNEAVLKKKVPILGICLGVQLFTKSSEEGVLPGLGWIDGQTLGFKQVPDFNLKIPHMGWNTVDVAARDQELLFKDMDAEPRFYFVHSFYLKCSDPADSMCRSRYGITFVSGVHKENIYGTQFHPEKSHKFGLKIIKNFLDL